MFGFNWRRELQGPLSLLLAGVQHQRDKLSQLRTVGHTASSIDIGGTVKTRVPWKRDRHSVNAGVLYKRNRERGGARTQKGFCSETLH